MRQSIVGIVGLPVSGLDGAVGASVPRCRRWVVRLWRPPTPGRRSRRPPGGVGAALDQAAAITHHIVDLIEDVLYPQTGPPLARPTPGRAKAATAHQPDEHGEVAAEAIADVERRRLALAGEDSAWVVRIVAAMKAADRPLALKRHLTARGLEIGHALIDAAELGPSAAADVIGWFAGYRIGERDFATIAAELASPELDDTIALRRIIAERKAAA